MVKVWSKVGVSGLVAILLSAPTQNFRFQAEKSKNLIIPAGLVRMCRLGSSLLTLTVAITFARTINVGDVV